MRQLGLRGVLRIEAPTLRRLVKATLAATLAWQAAAWLHSPRPALASLAAILVVQITVRATVARSIQLTIGVTAGLVLAVALGNLLGLHWWTIGFIVLGGLIVGELLRLGPLASQAAISALLAFSLGSSYGILRIVDTLVGAAIGVAVNVLVAPPSFVAETAATLRRVGADLGDLLVDIGDGLSDGLGPADPPRWLDRARGVADELHAASQALDQAEESVRFNPLARSADAQVKRLGEARLALEHASSQVRGIARALGDVVRPRDVTIDPAATGLRSGPDDPGATDAAPTDAARSDTARSDTARSDTARSDTARSDTAPSGTASTDTAALSRLLHQLGTPLSAAGYAVAAFGRLQENPASRPTREDALRAGAAAAAGQAAVATTVADMSHRSTLLPGHALLASSILVDLARVIREVDVEHGAHADAVTAD